MIRLGVKITHDGGLAALDGSTLLFSHEAEKSANLTRHSPLRAIDVDATLAQYDLAHGDVDRVVVDGWIEGRAPVAFGADSATVTVAGYHESSTYPDPLAPVALGPFGLGSHAHRDTLSYTHVAGHALGTYATSPWASAGWPALVLVWDGAMLPRLYRFEPAEGRLQPLRPLLGLVGHVYPVFASFFGPFVPGGGQPDHDALPKEALLGLSGKAMAWVGLGMPRPEVTEVLESVYRGAIDLRFEYAFEFARTVHARCAPLGVSDADVLASFQAFLGDKLVGSLGRLLERDSGLPRRLCFTGGCALNIAWNAKLRASGLFEDVWVPPFPNDAGSALGAAVADMVRAGEGHAIEWDVYRGPALTPSRASEGWASTPCDLGSLAAFLYERGEPVVFLNGRAELGPRALGNRSILCSPARRETKERLNEIKRRAWYRPVAPICLESHAPRVFDPGTPDPYMLFTHAVRPEWLERVPAVVHVDGTARLQTINVDQNAVVAELLERFHRLSGIPLLCNTSANLHGSGFFPDLASALEWPGATHVWCEGALYSRARVEAAIA